jgi:hypothetical protein
MSPPPPPNPKLELFILPGALFTRRVLIYLFEKGLLISTPTPNANGRELESKFIKIVLSTNK